jgi:hypothetical protein
MVAAPCDPNQVSFLAGGGELSGSRKMSLIEAMCHAITRYWLKEKPPAYSAQGRLNCITSRRIGNKALHRRDSAELPGSM